MLETPPPKIMASGSKMSITFAIPIPKFSKKFLFHSSFFSSERFLVMVCNDSFFPVSTNQLFSSAGTLIYV